MNLNLDLSFIVTSLSPSNSKEKEATYIVLKAE